MVDWFVNTLRSYPEIAIFLALAFGFWFGRKKFGTFSLGVVTSTLIAGVLIGQMNITISPNVKSTFFLMFLFAVGYGVGPQFFRGLKGDGIPQVIFAVVICLSVLASAVVMGKIMGYDVGLTAGLLSGAATISAVIGVATDSINQLGLGAEEKKALINSIPIAYAVTYIFGTAGSAWFLASVAPKLLGFDLKEECRKYEAELGGSTMPEGTQSAYRELGVRAYRLTNPSLIGRPVRDLEALYGEQRTFVERIRVGNTVMEVQPDTVLQQNAVVAVAGRISSLVEHAKDIGPEIDDKELMNIPAELLDVVVTKKELDGKTLAEIAGMEPGHSGRGVFLRKVVRSGQEMPFGPNLKIHRGDTLTIVGAKRDVDRAAAFLGYADRATEQTDMSFMALGIVVGALVGVLAIRVGGVPLSLSTSGGALIAGLICGWLRSVHRTLGRIPAPALWVFNNIGLNVFIAVVGISAGPGFVAGLQQNGLSLFLAGVVVTTVPFIIALYFGKYVLKMRPPILLGAAAGGRTTTAALGAIQEAAQSKVPALGYTVTYAVGNTLLTIWGVVVVLLMT
jgi:putative transport protein